MSHGSTPFTSLSTYCSSRFSIIPLSHPGLYRLLPGSVGSDHHMTNCITDRCFGLDGKDQRDYRGYKSRQWGVYDTVIITQKNIFFVTSI
jgi:hypothetical protein